EVVARHGEGHGTWAGPAQPLGGCEAARCSVQGLEELRLRLGITWTRQAEGLGQVRWQGPRRAHLGSRQEGREETGKERVVKRGAGLRLAHVASSGSSGNPQRGKRRNASYCNMGKGGSSESGRRACTTPG